MAIFFPGKTRCAICDQVVNEDDHPILFPPFVLNRKDPLIIFDDATCHEECLLHHPKGQLALLRAEELMQKADPWQNVCVVCNTHIIQPDDYFWLSHLTDDSNAELYKYNYLQFHKSHLSLWCDLQKAYDLISLLDLSGEWEGDWLKYLMRTMELALSRSIQK